MFKYADDTNLLVPAYSDVSLLSEFEHVEDLVLHFYFSQMAEKRRLAPRVLDIYIT